MESLESKTRFCSVALLLLLISLLWSQLPSSSAQQQHEPNPTIRTMEDFSGYPIHEPGQFGSINLASSLSVDAPGLQKQIEELSSFSDAPSPSVTRVLYTDKDVSARRYVKNLMTLAGLSVREDAVGNIFGKWDGSEPSLPAVATGSHIDAIPYSGKYDGVVGVLGAIEAINVLKRSGFKPKRSLEIIMFTSEEPTRFGISCLGSRLLAGSKELAEALKTTVVDGQNVSFIEAAKSAGYAEDEHFSSVFLKKGSYFAFIELHIEQGPILEDEGLDIGVVTAIAAPASLKVEFEGNGGHAGAVLMPYRNDAGLAAAELALAVEKHVLESESIDTVGTVGILELHPGAINSIPSKSHLEIGIGGSVEDTKPEREEMGEDKVETNDDSEEAETRVGASKRSLDSPRGETEALLANEELRLERAGSQEEPTNLGDNRADRVEATDENDLPSPASKACERLAKAKGKEKALYDGNFNDDESFGSVESCNSAGLVSRGRKKRAGFEEQGLILGSKRLKTLSQECLESTSKLKQDSSFMNWISNMTKGIWKGNEEDNSPLVPLTTTTSDANGQVNAIVDQPEMSGCRNTGFQSFFQSIYCQKKSDQDAVEVDNANVASLQELPEQCLITKGDHVSSSGNGVAPVSEPDTSSGKVGINQTSETFSSEKKQDDKETNISLLPLKLWSREFVDKPVFF
ncbi:hypothetical protein F2Q68_00035671 [Brassica cretica]|uniref:Peptidase M20 dimerisation domain-containing protein n=1 Tax=Brassica cretica TaxID=69181 RepID=A0A8S9H0T8_BRACR|nr:hypothetical protein F2Q68_00035671 [Brassica cretica]